MNVHLVDGTYELFRYYYGVPSHENSSGREVGAVRGVVGSVLQMIADGGTHVAVATDSVLTSFRNELWEGYKDGSGVEPELLDQFGPLEEALLGLGVPVWGMVEYEADDALASGARSAARYETVSRVLICSPDKDLAQCVEDDRVVQVDRRRERTWDARGVVERFGIGPGAVTDYLALVGDTADGFPGLKGWGPKSAATVLARYGKLDRVPLNHNWDVELRGQTRLRSVLKEGIDDALLFRKLATLETDLKLFDDIDRLRWTGPSDDFPRVCADLDAPGFLDRVDKLAMTR